MEFTVFYAWQSDRPERANRYLIRDAAKEALRQIGKDASIQESPRLDHDTKGVSGMPDIVGTIFKKIEGCGVFLADLTFVGTTQEGKQLPNPNVVLELGYAARCIGWERIICVVNEAFGPAEELIFDIKHRRWPIVYELGSDDRKQAREVTKKLAEEIKEAVLSVLNSEYSAVEDAISGLTTEAFLLLKAHAEGDGFVFPFQKIEEIGLINQVRLSATSRLVDLKIIQHCHELEYEDHPSNKHPIKEGLKSMYSWTYLGIRVLKRLGFRP